MRYEPLLTKVSVAFYAKPENMTIRERIISLLISLLSNADIHHSGIMLSRGNNCIMLAANKDHKAKLIDQSIYHRKVRKPTVVIELGEFHVSIKQMIDFLKEPYKGDVRSLLFWSLVGRFLLPGTVPKSCSILSCQLLRIAGYHIKDCYTPIQLYNEIQNKGTVYSWQEFAKENDLRS